MEFVVSKLSKCIAYIHTCMWWEGKAGRGDLTFVWNMSALCSLIAYLFFYQSVILPCWPPGSQDIGEVMTILCAFILGVNFGTEPHENIEQIIHKPNRGTQYYSALHFYSLSSMQLKLVCTAFPVVFHITQSQSPLLQPDCCTMCLRSKIWNHNGKDAMIPNAIPS